ncbi:hypothetical protein D8T65_15860 [Vibrio vulnificus]|uniref:hypothetical protein n=1 Tax=Vibrio vulnificus TaxID=672 RepID=UPI001029A936|nr:hypothetical protein [Vibrio vulnificus]RZQ00381.1 hypothetical protein D8T65_15860 [Vibrio vulnificus]
MSVDNENKNTPEEKNDKTKFIARSQKIGPEKNVEKSKIEPVSVKEINKQDNINDKSHTKRRLCFLNQGTKSVTHDLIS